MPIFKPQGKRFIFKPTEKRLTNSETISGQTQCKLVGSAKIIITSSKGNPNLTNEEKPFLGSRQTGSGTLDANSIELGRHSRHYSNPSEVFLDENTRMNLMRQKLGMVQSKLTVIFIYLPFSRMRISHPHLAKGKPPPNTGTNSQPTPKRHMAIRNFCPPRNFCKSPKSS
jgi:hypothetical protein